MRYRFGNCELVLDRQELFRNGQRCAIEPQVFDLLTLLVTERDRLVTRDELIAVVWQGRIVSESAIGARISAVRAAIGDDGASQKWIRTIPRRGLRFVGEVEVLNEGETTVAPASRYARQYVRYCRSADGTRIAFARSGAGYPLLRAGHWLTHLEHDWNSPIWRPLLDGLSSDFELTRYDQRGNGLSEWNVSDFSLERLIEDMEAVVDAAGVGRFALYASSQGVPVAVGYTARHPDRVSHLILHGGFAKGRLLRATESERAQGEAILTLIRYGWGQHGSSFIKAFSTMFMPGGSREQLDSLSELQRRSTSPANAALIRTAIDQLDISELLGTIATPTLVLHAKADAIQPLEQGQEIAAGIPGAEFQMLDSNNHILLPQEPAFAHSFESLREFVLGK